jgi:hypothetical protein
LFDELVKRKAVVREGAGKGGSDVAVMPRFTSNSGDTLFSGRISLYETVLRGVLFEPGNTVWRERADI